MCSLKIYDIENNKIFDKFFNSPFLRDKFKNKLKYSKKLKVIGVSNNYV